MARTTIPLWRRLLVGASILILMAIGFSKYFANRQDNTPLKDVCTEALTALRNKDANKLWARLFEPERECMKLSKRSFEKLLHWSTGKIEDWNLAEAPVEVNTSPNDDVYFATYHLKGAGNEDAYLNFVIYRTQEGPRLQLLGELLVLGFQSRYLRNFHYEPLTIRNWSANAMGARKEAKALIEMGVRGMPIQRNFVYSLRPFDRLATSMEAGATAEKARKTNYLGASKTGN